jgi:Ser/Thr protein kinase RdoA (MazF antagonist)
VLDRVRDASDQMGKGKKVYGLIHADLGIGDNVAFLKGEARPFDFDDCGFGYWLFDFGVILSQYMMDFNDTSSVMRDALLDGYQEITTLEDIGIEYLDLFIAARVAQLMFFYQASSLAHPEHMEEAKREISVHGKHLKRFLKRIQ